MDIKIIFAIIAAIVGIGAFLPYLVTVVFGNTRPHSLTWLIWAITQGVGVSAIWYGGGGYGAISLTIGWFLVVTVFLISLKKGTRSVTRNDLIIFILALIAVVIWIFMDSPFIAVLMVTVIDLLGYIPTFRKSYASPWDENTLSWDMFAAANLFSILALGEYNFLTWGYLAAMMIANSSLHIYLIIRRHRVSLAKQ